MVSLRPMTEGELRAFLDASIPRYAEAHVGAGQWAAEEALERSRVEHERLLPQGVATPDNFLRSVLDETTGTRVGELWYAVRRETLRPQVFVYWVGIEPAFRRHGYASAVLREVEAEARRLRADRVALHVFGNNVGARRLYGRLGYSETNVLMAKAIAD